MNKLFRGFKYLFLTIASFISIFPFIWMLIGATNASVDVVKGKIKIGSHLLANAKSLSETNFTQSTINSIILVIIITILSLLISSMAGYGFEIYKSKGKDIAFGIILSSMMIPFAAIMIPLYRLFGKLGLLDTFFAVVFPNCATAFLIFFFRQNTKAFPKDLIQVARLEGLTELGVFFRIYIPVMKSTYAAAAIITFMNTWNNYMWPLIALQSQDKQTVPIVLAYLGSAVTPDYGMVMLGLVLATIPMAIVFFLLQKSFVEGMTGAMKG